MRDSSQSMLLRRSNWLFGQKFGDNEDGLNVIRRAPYTEGSVPLI